MLLLLTLHEWVDVVVVNNLSLNLTRRVLVLFVCSAPPPASRDNDDDVDDCVTGMTASTGDFCWRSYVTYTHYTHAHTHTHTQGDRDQRYYDYTRKLILILVIFCFKPKLVFSQKTVKRYHAKQLSLQKPELRWVIQIMHFSRKLEFEKQSMPAIISIILFAQIQSNKTHQ